MTITTKENANGKIYAYYVDGVKVRKNEIDDIIYSRRDEIITVDYYTGKNFGILTHYGRGFKIVLTGCANTIMTRPAAEELGYNVIRNFSGLYYGFCIVEKKSAEVDPEEYAITPAAMEIAIEAEIKAANKEKIAAMQKEIADYIAKIDEQEKQDKVAAFERELIEKGIIKGTAKVANVTNETDGSEDDSDEEFTVDVMPVDDDDTEDELIDEAVVNDGNFTFYDAQIHSYDDDFVSEQFDNPIDAYKWLEMKIKQSYALERGTRQIEFYGKDSYKVIYRYIPDCRELFIDDTQLENFITKKTPKFTYKTKRGKIRTLKIGETNWAENYDCDDDMPDEPAEISVNELDQLEQKIKSVKAEYVTLCNRAAQLKKGKTIVCLNNFFNAQKIGFKEIFEASFKIQLADNTEQTFIRYFATFDEAKALVVDFKANFSEPTKICIRRNPNRQKLYTNSKIEFGDDGFDETAFDLLPSVDELNDIEDTEDEEDIAAIEAELAEKGIVVTSRGVFATDAYIEARKAYEHIQNVYSGLLDFIDIMNDLHGLTQEQCEQIYVALFADRNYCDPLNVKLRDKMIAEFEAYNKEHGIKRNLENRIRESICLPTIKGFKNSVRTEPPLQSKNFGTALNRKFYHSVRAIRLRLLRLRFKRR